MDESSCTDRCIYACMEEMVSTIGKLQSIDSRTLTTNFIFCTGHFDVIRDKFQSFNKLETKPGPVCKKVAYLYSKMHFDVERS